MQLTCAKGATMCDAYRLTTAPPPLAGSGGKCAPEGKPCARHSNCCTYASEPRGQYCQPASASNSSSGTAASPQTPFVCKDDCFPPTAQGEVVAAAALLCAVGPRWVAASVLPLLPEAQRCRESPNILYNSLKQTAGLACNATPAMQWL